jgi:hypothetical protein
VPVLVPEPGSVSLLPARARSRRILDSPTRSSADGTLTPSRCAFLRPVLAFEMLELIAAVLGAQQLLPSIPQKLHGTKNMKPRCQSVHNGTDACIHLDYSVVSAALLAHEEVSAASSLIGIRNAQS